MLTDPIIFIGMPRSGTTIIFEAFTENKSLAWLSNYFYHLPVIPEVGLIHNIFFHKKGVKNQGQNINIFNRFLPKPAEAYMVWEKYFGKIFSFTFLTNEKPKQISREKCLSFFEKYIKYQRKKRLAIKLTGPPRAQFLNEVFQNARYVNIIRDPRAVIASLHRESFWINNEGLKKPYWDGGLKIKDKEILKKYNYSSKVLAALLWKRVYEHTIKEFDFIKKPLFQVRYEEFMKKPESIIQNICAFVNIDYTKTVKEYVTNFKYTNMNYKYKNYLSINEIEDIEKVLKKEMISLKYM